METVEQTAERALAERPLADLSIATIRTLAMDAVQAASSGHPGAPMALAPLAYVLFREFLRHNPAHPAWFDRDRFVLSNGHASMLLYAVLHLTGYDLSLDDLRRFRQWASKTPGHPERRVTPGVEVTTGPLGQGIMNAVGMAMAEAHLAAVYNRENHHLIDHRTWVLCSDGDLMEGASHEAASLAGRLRLGKLIAVYDDNDVTIDGHARLSNTEDVVARFRAYGWDVQTPGDRANDLEALRGALARAAGNILAPSLIVLRTHIAWGAPKLQDSPKAHGAPLGVEEVRGAKRRYGWPEDAQFLVPERARAHMREARDRGVSLEAQWNERFAAYRLAHPALAERLERAIRDEFPEGWDRDLPLYDGAAAQVATRAAGSRALNHFASRIPWLMGGAADLASSTGAAIKDGGDFEPTSYTGRNIHWGVREHEMCAASSGLASHGGVRPFASTFFVFTDYARPAIRLAALMELPVIYVLTHDSIGLGEDGPTHQPVEHLASFRAMPNVCVLRPADANETVYAWRAALARRAGPTLLVLSRQPLPVFDRRHVAPAAGTLRGAYVIAREEGPRPELILIATGSEVALALAARGELAVRHGVDARVVSMPSWELFREQDRAYRDEVLPPAVDRRLAIEAGATLGWREWVGDRGAVIGIDRFGASAPGEVLLERFGFTVAHAVERALALLERKF